MPRIRRAEGDVAHDLQLLRRARPDRPGAGLLPGGDHLPGLRRRRRADHRSLHQLPRRGPSPDNRPSPGRRSARRRSGMWLQLRNQGELGDVGAPRGNLRIQVLVKKHPFFERRRNDLICQVPISFAQAALGAVIEVPTLEGREHLEVPRGTQSGEILRIKGRGMPDIGGRARGDELVEVIVETPRHLTASPGRAAARIRRDRARTGQPPPQELLRETARLFHRRDGARPTRTSLELDRAGSRPVRTAIRQEQ